MSQKAFIGVSGAIFGLIALLHLARLLYGWPVQIGIVTVPTWVSWLGLLVAGSLALTAFALLRK